MFQIKNETLESVGEMNSPSSDEASEIEVQIIPDNETDFGLVENIKTEKEDKERLLNSELRGYEEESSSCEVRIIKSENPEMISKQSRAQREYRIFPDIDSSLENENNIEAIDFFLKEKSMLEKLRKSSQKCEKNLTISEERNTQHKNIFSDKETNFILGIDNNDEVLDENVSLNSESRELKEEESILGNEQFNYVINSEKATTSANGSIGQYPEEAILNDEVEALKDEISRMRITTTPDVHELEKQFEEKTKEHEKFKEKYEDLVKSTNLEMEKTMELIRFGFREREKMVTEFKSNLEAMASHALQNAKTVLQAIDMNE
ncbi:UNVERIFIED_CONTAM: hypothetical protein RMT77_016737 [Armadillidium vulgare]